jgi:uncharacterized protein YcnI
VSAIGLLALAGPVSAHVTVAADDSTKGAADSILTFRVPNEQDAATTIRVDIKFPVKDTIASVKPAATPGWVVTSKTVKFSPPIKTDDVTITDGVGEVIYAAAPGNKGIPVGGFGASQILVGPLPDADQVAFPTAQTYSNGKGQRLDRTGHRPGPPAREPDPHPHAARGNRRRRHPRAVREGVSRPRGGPVELRDQVGRQHRAHPRRDRADRRRARPRSRRHRRRPRPQNRGTATPVHPPLTSTSALYRSPTWS